MKFRNKIMYLTIITMCGLRHVRAELFNDVLGDVGSFADHAMQRAEHLVAEGQFKTNDELMAEQQRAKFEGEKRRQEREHQEDLRRRTDEIDRKRALEHRSGS